MISLQIVFLVSETNDVFLLKCSLADRHVGWFFRTNGKLAWQKVREIQTKYVRSTRTLQPREQREQYQTDFEYCRVVSEEGKAKSVIKVLVFFQQKPRKTPADGISLIRLLQSF